METTTQTTPIIEAPKCCETCIYCATHEKCEGCLHTEGRSLSAGDPFEFNNWVEELGIIRMWEHEISGQRNIVIGGMGEAEINTKWTPQEAAKHLHYVAEQCGYLAERLVNRGTNSTMVIGTHEGNFRITWENGELVKIWATYGGDGWDWDCKTMQDIIDKLTETGAYTPELY
jgi:hypothetical protein